ncbi:MAG: NADPH-dependent F420 reductase [Chloroflexota bacterium]|nr:NADPH-dependent F420 reductase [Anaerolineae bacterium]HMM27001.1 NADPH-dependent F420 reductase [Aggregatilineaceae bacterium]
MGEHAERRPAIAVIGGTGKEGSGLALRWAHSGYEVLIGSRDAERAAEKADELNRVLGKTVLRGLDNASAAAAAELVVLTVPYQAHKPILESIKEAAQGKILVDVTVPLQPPAIRTVHIPEGKAASLEAQALLGPEVRVVAAFQNISHTHLKDLDDPVDSDVLMASDDDEAKHEVARLIEAIPGMRAIDIGPLANAIAAEALTPVILYINKRYKAPGAGIRITGLDA